MLATLAFLFAVQEKPVYMCPVMANRPTSKRMALDYGSTRVYVCCDQCVRTVWRDGADKLLARMKGTDTLMADVVFDAVSHARVNEYKAKYWLRDGNKNWLFESQENLTTFQAGKKALEVEPPLESLTCPSCGKTLATTGEATNYTDEEGCRIYFCSKACSQKELGAETLHDFVKKNGEPRKTRPVPVPGIKW